MLNYKIGDIVKGKVTGIEKYGIFVLVDENTTGLIHISEISDFFVRDVSDYAELNEVIKAKVLNVDLEHNKLKLSIKDIPYRASSKKKSGIVETKSGFHNLEKCLDKWVKEAEKEMDFDK